jgi:hypothetical protein
MISAGWMDVCRKTGGGLPYGAGWCIVTGQSHSDSERRLIEELVGAALVATADEAALEGVPAFSWQDNAEVLRLACRLR